MFPMLPQKVKAKSVYQPWANTMTGLYDADFQGAEAKGPNIKGVLWTEERFIPHGFMVGTGRLSSQVFHFQYNPAELTYRRNVNIGHIDAPGNDLPRTFFISADPDVISFSLLMEAKTFETRSELLQNYAEGILPQLYCLLAMTASDEALGNSIPKDPRFVVPRRPPRVTFALGEYLVVPVWVRTVEIRVQEWNNNMIPVRAIVDVTLVARGEPTQLGFYRDTVLDWAMKYNNPDTFSDRAQVGERQVPEIT